MRKIIVASTNPVKLAAVRAAFFAMFPGEEFTYEGVSVPSGVPDQPMGDAQTYEGAKNRAGAAAALHPEADFCVGLEGGIEEHASGDLCASAWMVVRRKDGKEGRGKTSVFFLPDAVADLVRSGMELGHANDQVFSQENSKQKNGAVGLLTRDVVTRESYYKEALVMALIPFKNDNLY
jgi:inosine/xanthosine triphosphatase